MCLIHEDTYSLLCTEGLEQLEIPAGGVTSAVPRVEELSLACTSKPSIKRSHLFISSQIFKSLFRLFMNMLLPIVLEAGFACSINPVSVCFALDPLSNVLLLLLFSGETDCRSREGSHCVTKLQNGGCGKQRRENA